VAWEHLNIVTFAEILLNRFHEKAALPDWPNSDYDTVFVLTIEWSEPAHLRFEVRHEGLDGLPDACP
jgi:hypothetical protein